VWRAADYLDAIENYESKVGKSLRNIVAVVGNKNEKNTILEEYKKMPTRTVDGKPMSVDFAVVEKVKKMLVVEGNFFWTDIGDWKEVWNNLPQDELGNVIIDGNEPGGRVYNIDTSDALIHTNGRPIAVVDVDNIVIVDTKDALLVCSKSKAQNVKKIVNQLKEEGRKELL
jgi:mannose-1-phosphate guanylyltransferase